ncbi:MAG: Bro-N domain-containing protein [Xenococcaceae cyanobacterium]
MSIVKAFEFEGNQIRFVGTTDRPEWIAQDVCDILETGQAGNVLRNFSSNQKGMYTMHTLGGKQEMLTVTEAGLYRLIFQSHCSVAERFQNWVFDEVLPSLRKYGCYPPPAEKSEELSSAAGAIAFSVDMLKLAGVSESLQASFALTQKATIEPENALIYEEAKRLLSAQMQLEEIPMSPTELGKAIANKLDKDKAPSARKVNEALRNAGLQVASYSTSSSGRKKIEWHLTETGKKYGQLQMDSGTGSGKTIVSVRWFSSVISVIEKNFAASQQCDLLESHSDANS